MTGPRTAAHPREAGVQAIILYKLIKAGLGAAAGLLALGLWLRGAEAASATLAQHLLEHVTRAWAMRAATLIVTAGTSRHALIVGVGALADAAVSAVEGFALKAGRWWAPWLVVFATGALLPWEIFEVIERPRVSRFVLLALNALVVIYLLRKAIREHEERKHGADGGGSH